MLVPHSKDKQYNGYKEDQLKNKGKESTALKEYKKQNSPRKN